MDSISRSLLSPSTNDLLARLFEQTKRHNTIPNSSNISCTSSHSSWYSAFRFGGEIRGRTYRKLTFAYIQAFPIKILIFPFSFRSPRYTCVHRWQISTKALAKTIGVWNTPVSRCCCTIKVRPVHVPLPASHTYWPNVVHVSHSGKIASTICRIIVWPDQHFIQCAYHPVRTTTIVLSHAVN